MKSFSSDARSFKSSDSGGWRCPSPPPKAEDPRKTKSDFDPRYWETGPHKYERQIGENWIILNKYKKFYAEDSSSESEDDALNRGGKDSESEGSQLTEGGTCDSFDATYEVSNAARNFERKEMHKIKKYIRNILRKLVNKSFKKAMKNE